MSRLFPDADEAPQTFYMFACEMNYGDILIVPLPAMAPAAAASTSQSAMVRSIDVT